MISAVLDTNTIVSGILVSRGIPSAILDAAYARTFRGVKVVSPRTFLAIVSGETEVDRLE